jgi:hypothetical protein
MVSCFLLAIEKRWHGDRGNGARSCTTDQRSRTRAKAQGMRNARFVRNRGENRFSLRRDHRSENRQGFCRRRCGKRNAIFSPLLWLIGERESAQEASKTRWNVKGGSQVGGLFWARPTESYAALDLDSRQVRYQTEKSVDAFP